MAKAANTVVTGDIQETEWFGIKPDVFTTSTTIDFVFDDDTGFANEITWCDSLVDDVIRLDVTSKVQCGEGPSNLNSQFGDLTFDFDAEVYYCDTPDKGKSNACIRKIQPFTSKRDHYTSDGSTAFDQITDMKFTDSDGVTDDIKGLAIAGSQDIWVPGTEYDFGEGCLVGISGEYFEDWLFRVKFHYADGFVKDTSCNVPEPEPVVEDEKTGAILMKAGLASLTLATFASV
jgi:hypothetical protein